jgi:RNA polymerase sigma factor (sigma-70 family)
VSRGLGVGEIPASSAVMELNDAALLERFVTRRDEGAFRLLVERYGPLVLGVCRRVLRDAHLAEDAFQATFLLLVQKSQTLSRPASVGSWLYGAAYRVAAKARARAAKRRALERQAAVMPPAPPQLELAWRELQAVLDEEVSALPDKYRDALVLCHFQGMTHEQAADILGCPAGSMSWKLAHGREMLRKRLIRRGLALSAGVLALLLSWCIRMHVSRWVVESTVQSATACVSGNLAAISSSILGLCEEAGNARARGRAGRRALLALAALAFLLSGAIGSWLALSPSNGAQPQSSQTAPPSPRGCCGGKGQSAAPSDVAGPRSPETNLAD